MTKYRSFWPILTLIALGLILAACNQAIGSISTQTGTESAPSAVPETLAEPTKPPTGELTGSSAAVEPTEPAEVRAAGTVWVANGMEDSLTAIDLVTGEQLLTIQAGINPHILSASPDGQIIYVINAGGHDREPNAHAETGEGDMGSRSEASTPDNHGGQMSMSGQSAGEDMSSAEHAAGDDSMAMSESASEGNSLWAIEAKTGDVIARVAVGRGPTHPIPSPDGQRVYVTNTDEGSVSVIDTASWSVVATIPEIPEPHDGELTPDGRWLYLATAGNNTMAVVDTMTNEVVSTFPVGAKPRGVAAGGEQGEIAYVTNKGEGTLTIIDVQNGAVLNTVPVGEGAHAVRVSPDGSTVYVALSKANAVVAVDAVTGSVKQTFPVGATPEQIDLSGDGRWLVASNNADATITIFDLERPDQPITINVGKGAYGVQIVPVSVQSQSAQQPMPGPMLMGRKNADGFVDITVQELAAMLEEKAFTLVNVHIPYEGELPQTDLFIPFNEIARRVDQLPDKSAPIVVYCRSGSMSTVAAKALVQLGYTNVMELDGGFNAWQAAGYELIR
ncbi:MAG: hypothetical protein Kow0047_05730 [Anaerolineae bacterium]